MTVVAIVAVAVVIILFVALVAVVVRLNHSIFDRKLGGPDERRSFGAALRTGTVPPGAARRLWSRTLHESRSSLRVAIVLSVVSIAILTCVLAADLATRDRDLATTGPVVLSIVCSAVGVVGAAVNARRHRRLLAELERLGPLE